MSSLRKTCGVCTALRAERSGSGTPGTALLRVSVMGRMGMRALCCSMAANIAFISSSDTSGRTPS